MEVTWTPSSSHRPKTTGMLLPVAQTMTSTFRAASSGRSTGFNSASTWGCMVSQKARRLPALRL